MGDTEEQLVELLRMLKPFVNTPEGQQTVVDILSKEKVAQEVTKMLAVLGLLDAGALENGLSKLVSQDPSSTPQPANVPPFQPGLPGFPPQPVALQPPPQPGFHPPIHHQPYGVPPGSHSMPQPHLRAQQPPFPPPSGPLPAPPVPGFAQGLGLSADDQAMVLRALSMSQAEIDMLAPQQRQIFMQLRSLAGR